MPIKKIIKTPDYKCFFWKIEEDTDSLITELNPDKEEIKEIQKIKHEKRKKQNIAARIMLNKCAKKKIKLNYFVNGKPFCTKYNHISISHSGLYCALVTSDKNTGIDLQYKNNKIKHLSSKFIHVKEQVIIKKNNIKNLHFIWCAKEAIYKTLNTQCSLKENIHITTIKDNKGHGYYTNDNIKIRYNIIFDIFSDYFIAIAVKDDRNL